MATYSLGSTDSELARLDQQSARILGPTRVLLSAAGLVPGMRVLDLGTGLGDVAFLLADLVGPDGSVVGLDRDPRMLEVARDRVAGRTNVTFVEGDAMSSSGTGEFDAVVSRLLVLHLPDPAAVIREHLAAVRPGGRVVHIDYDTRAAGAEPAVPLVTQMFGLVAAALRSAGADPVIGSRLSGLLTSCGVEEVAGFGVTQYLSPDDPVGPALLRGVVGSLAPRMIEHGLVTADELDLDTLADRIAAELRASGRCSYHRRS